MKWNNNKALMCGVLGLTLGMTSCVDENYDLNDIDMTLSIDTDLKLPKSSTGDILLKNIMDLKEDGVVRLIQDPSNPGDSMYVVKQSGSANVDPIKIEEVKIAKPTIYDFHTKADIRELFNTPSPAPGKKSVRKNMNIAVPGKTIVIPNISYHYDIKDGEAEQRLQDATAENMSKDIVEITNIKFEATTISLDLEVTGFPAHIPYMHLDNMTLNMPKELHVTSCKLNGKEVESFETPGKVQITKVLDDKRSTSEKLRLELTIDEASTGENLVFDGVKHRAELKGDFDIKGTFRVESDEMNQEAIQALVDQVIATWTLDDLNDFIANPDLHKIEGAVPDYLYFDGHTEFSQDVHVTHVTGKFQHEVDKIDPIKLNDLPAFLDDDNVVLDLENPMIFLSIENGIPADIKTCLTLKSNTDNNTPRSTGDLSINAGGNNSYYLADKVENKYLPVEHKDAQFVRIAGLQNLIKRIPKQVDVEVATVTLEATDLDITKEYPIDINYEIYAPLIFGPQFSLVYTMVDDGWDLGEDLEKLDAECIEITGLVTSKMPASLSLEVDLLDTEGNALASIDKKDWSLKVTANANRSPIKLTLKPKAGHTLNEIFSGKDARGKACQKLDGIRYRAKLDSPVPDQALKDGSSIKIDDIVIRLLGKVTYDAN